MAANLFDLSGKVALITGGNSGIGLGFGEGAIKHGASVCLWGTNPEKNASAVATLKTLAQEHGDASQKIHSIVCNVADEAAVEASFAETLDVFGRVDSCFANAGVARSGRFDETTTKEWRAVLDVNLDGLFYTLRAASGHMRARAEAGDAGGRLIGTASLGALMGMARVEAYGASKGAVISMMQALAVEYARFGVTANSVLPGQSPPMALICIPEPTILSVRIVAHCLSAVTVVIMSAPSTAICSLEHLTIFMPNPVKFFIQRSVASPSIS